MIYLVCFALSTFFAYMAGKQQKKWCFLLFSVLSIALPVLLAGFRDLSIGIDTVEYYQAKRFWGLASNADTIGEYFEYYTSKEFREYLFALIVALVGKTNNYTLFLTIVHAWIITCVYVGAFRLQKHIRPWLVMLLFYLAFYNHSLNIIRQYMAMSFAFAFVPDLLQKKYLRFILAVLLSALLHISGLLYLSLLVIYWILYGDFTRFKGLDPSMRSRKLFIFILFAAAVVAMYPAIALMIKMGFLTEKYSYYLEAPFTSYNLLVVLFLLVEMVPLFLLREELKKKTPMFDFFFTASVVYLILYQSTAILLYGKRIAACCATTNVVTLALLPEGLKNGITITMPRWLGGKQITMFRFLENLSENKKRAIGTVLVVAAVLFYWWYVYVIAKASETVPYRFIFQR